MRNESATVDQPQNHHTVCHHTGGKKGKGESAKVKETVRERIFPFRFKQIWQAVKPVMLLWTPTLPAAIFGSIPCNSSIGNAAPSRTRSTDSASASNVSNATLADLDAAWWWHKWRALLSLWLRWALWRSFLSPRSIAFTISNSCTSKFSCFVSCVLYRHCAMPGPLVLARSRHAFLVGILPMQIEELRPQQEND